MKYVAVGERANDHGYMLAYPKAAPLWRSRQDAICSSDQFTPGLQSHARCIMESTITAETKALAIKEGGGRGRAEDGDTSMSTPTQRVALTRDATAQTHAVLHPRPDRGRGPTGTRWGSYPSDEREPPTGLSRPKTASQDGGPGREPGVLVVAWTAEGGKKVEHRARSQSGRGPGAATWRA